MPKYDRMLCHLSSLTSSFNKCTKLDDNLSGETTDNTDRTDLHRFYTRVLVGGCVEIERRLTICYFLDADNADLADFIT